MPKVAKQNRILASFSANCSAAQLLQSSHFVPDCLLACTYLCAATCTELVHNSMCALLEFIYLHLSYWAINHDTLPFCTLVRLRRSKTHSHIVDEH